MPEMPAPPTKSIAETVLAHVRSKPENDEPLWDRCYAPDFESVEADGMKHTGRDQVKAKHAQWYGMMTVHDFRAHEAFCGADRFGILYEMDVEPKDGSWPRMNFREIGVYTVRDGKVVREEFLSA